MEKETLLTVGETAITLRVHTNTVRRWLNEGQLQGKKAGRKWLVPQVAIDAFTQRAQPVIAAK
jgi:excisionase family DNA binding protein